MSMDPTAVGKIDAIEALKSSDIRSLQDIDNIEAILLFIKDANSSVEKYKIFKKKKIQAIDEEIAALEENVEKAKKIIVETLNQFNEKAIRFPGVGKVSKRKKAGTWKISDEMKLIDVLMKEGHKDSCLKTEVLMTIKKAETNKVLDMWSTIDKVPEGCVEKSPDEEGVTISFDDLATDKNASIPVKSHD